MPKKKIKTPENKKRKKETGFFIFCVIMISLIVLGLVMDWLNKQEFNPETDVCLKTNTGHYFTLFLGEEKWCREKSYTSNLDCSKYPDKNIKCIEKVRKSECNLNSTNYKDCICTKREIKLSDGTRASSIQDFYNDCAEKLNISIQKVGVSNNFFYSDSLREISKSCYEITNKSGSINGWWYDSYCTETRVKELRDYTCEELFSYLILDKDLNIYGVSYSKEEIEPYFEECKLEWK